MIWIANTLVALVAALHVYFLVLEMFLWTRPLGLKTFRNSPERAADSAVLAANQGLYNGFLAAGLVWGLVQGNPSFAFQIKDVLFAVCHRRRRLRRGNRQSPDSVRPGCSRRHRVDSALVDIKSVTLRACIALHCQNRSANILAAMASTRLDQIIGKIKHLGEAAT
jgi:putative membrane protein